MRLRLQPTDLTRMRFAYSPLAETTESLYMLHAGAVSPIHRGWYEGVKSHLQVVDTALLRAAVPARGLLANVLLGGAVDARTDIEEQLAGVEACPVERLQCDLETAWRGSPLPPAAVRLLDRGPDAGRHLAQDLRAYWRAAIHPFWPRIRAVLDGDVAFRAKRLTTGGIEAMLADLHPELRLSGTALDVSDGGHSQHDLRGAGLLLIPSAFAWPEIVVDPGRTGPPSLTYGTYGIGTIWGSGNLHTFDDAALSALIGRGRAVILRMLAVPRSTTELATELSQSPATVNAHLAVLRRSGWAVSWRAGRQVLYQRTRLATSVLVAAEGHEGQRSRDAV